MRDGGLLRYSEEREEHEVYTDDLLEMVPLEQAKASLAKYLNSCWHGWHRKDDEYVVGVVESFKKTPVYSINCIFHWMLQISMLVLQRALALRDEQQLPNVWLPADAAVDGYRDVVRALVMTVVEDLRTRLATDLKEVCCEANCVDPPYDGTDFLTITVNP
eukprot:Sspe_Gene.30430::Locus_15066_Transcript_1_1_Confidence_1.000_Length_1182::g.30430::m.30430